MKTIKLVIDASEIQKSISDLFDQFSTLDDASHNIATEFFRHFLHLPRNFLVCADEFTATSTSDGVIRLSIRAPKLEILTAALTALKIGLTHLDAPVSEFVKGQNEKASA